MTWVDQNGLWDYLRGVHIGDVPPQYEWVWSPELKQYIHRRTEPLTYATDSTSVSDMGRREVIEFTDEHADADSTAIEHVWFNANTGRMTVRFKTKGTYSYDDVPEDTFEDFINAESLGGFFHRVFTPRGGDVWPGTKHDEGKIGFARVDREPVQIEADLDALKPEVLTSGRGKKFGLHFTYSAKGQMEVRARDMDEAIKLFSEYMDEHGFTAKVTAVTIDLT